VTVENFVDPVVHPGGPWTGSASKALVAKAKALGTGYFACADHGSLSEAMKVYRECKKQGVKPILGVELYFRDDDCPLARNTPSSDLKYLQVVVHCKDQAAFQHLTWVLNGCLRSVSVWGHEFPLVGWEELQEICRAAVTLMVSGPQSMVAKHLLVGRPDVAVKYYERLKHMVAPGDFYSCLVPTRLDGVWRDEVEVRLAGREGSFRLPSDATVETEHGPTARARYLAEKNSKHKVLKAFTYNGVRYEVGREIASATTAQGFSPIGKDLALQANLLHRALARRYGDQALVTSYAYFAKPENQLVQNLKMEDATRLQEPHHMRTAAEALPALAAVGVTEAEMADLARASRAWAAKFDAFDLQYDFSLPDPGGDPTKILVGIVKASGRMRWDDPVYLNRFKLELETIRDNGVIDLIPYFLPIRDVLDHYKAHGELTGPGRGSAGASLIAYCLGITHVDPIYYDLPFSRFLSAKRISKGDFPDIDTDMPHRDLLVGKDGNGGYLYQRWGDMACQISTRSMMRLKSAIKDVNRFVHGAVQEDVDKFAGSLPTPPQGMSDKDYVFGYETDEGHEPGLIERSEELQDYVTQRPREWEVVEQCLGIARQVSRHASAFIISNKDLRRTIPLVNVNGVRRVSAYEAGEVEAAKLIKYDFLNVKVLMDIGMCLRLINKRNGSDYEIGLFDHGGVKTYVWDLPVDHEANKQMWLGRTETTWQTNTVTMLPYVKAIKPGHGAKETREIIRDYALVGALVRPGPLDFIVEETGLNMAETYVKLRFGELEPDIPELARYLPETHGVIVYQEQLTKLAAELAEMPVDDAEDLRKHMCIAKDSRVKTVDGMVAIQDVEIGTLVQVEDGSYQKVVDKFYQGKKETIKIRLDDGEELLCTDDHPILTQKGWVKAGELTKEHMVKQFWTNDRAVEEGDERDWIVGMMLADGSVPDKASYSIAAGSQEKAEFVKEVAERSFGVIGVINETINEQKGWKCKNVRLIAKDGKNPLREYFKENGLHGLTTFNKKWPAKITRMMLLGFLEGDGCFNNHTVQIRSRALAEGIMQTFHGMGLRCNLFTNNKNRGMLTLRWEPGAMEPYSPHTKYDRVYKKKYGRLVPKPDWLGQLEKSDKRSAYFYPAFSAKRNKIALSIVEDLEREYNLTYGHKNWARVLRIEKDQVQEVYDLEIENIHSFVVGGTVVHNCKKKKVEMLKLKPSFMEGASRKVGAETAGKIWDRMETFAQYGFSIIHSTEYAMITYATVFLKHNYPLEWWTAVLTNAEEKEIVEVFWKHVRDLVLPPDINLSSESMTVDYGRKAIRSKLSMISGISDEGKVLQAIVAGRPYRDLEDFVRKGVCGQALARKLILVGVMDSFFEPGAAVETKMLRFDEVAKRVDHEGRMEEHRAKVAAVKAAVAAGAKKTKPKEPVLKPATVEEVYVTMTPVVEFQLKKQAMPSMNLELRGIVARYPNRIKVGGTPERPTVTYYDSWFRRERDGVPLVVGDDLQRLDGMAVTRDVVVAAAAYVVEAKEFTYHGTKKAFKMVLDTDGYVHEKIVWGDRETGKLSYDPGIKKGAVLVLICERRAGKPHTNLREVIVEQPALEKGNSKKNKEKGQKS
jgi:DNA polymerase III alpha subunit